MIIREEQETVHRGGVNTLMMDAVHNQLYSGGRDGIIQVWDMNNLKEPYIMSMEHHTDWINDIVVCCNGRHCKLTYC